MGHFPVFSQTKVIDSLKREYVSPKNAGALKQIELQVLLAQQYQIVSKDSALHFYSKSRSNANAINDTFWICKSYFRTAAFNIEIRQFDSAEHFLNHIYKYLPSPNGISKKLKLVHLDALMRSGLLYSQIFKFDKALDYYYAALKNGTLLLDNGALVVVYNSIGNVYFELKDMQLALKNYQKAVDLAHQSSDFALEATLLINIGNTLSETGNDKEAIVNFYRALRVSDNLSDASVKGSIYSNIAVSYNNLNQLDSAENFYDRALAINLDLGNIDQYIFDLGNIGTLYTQQKKFKKAELYLIKAFVLADSIELMTAIPDISLSLHDLFNQTKNYEKALKYYKMHILYRDSLYSDENRKASIQKEMQYEFDKKQVADSLMLVKEREVTSAQFKQEKTTRYALFGGLALVIIFAVFMVNRFTVTQKQKAIIQRQKVLVEEKQKEVMDSIKYARRIQQALLPNESTLKKMFCGKS
jgi:tetratricopeptide (TPR) repeat protein